MSFSSLRWFSSCLAAVTFLPLACASDSESAPGGDAGSGGGSSGGGSATGARPSATGGGRPDAAAGGAEAGAEPDGSAATDGGSVDASRTDGGIDDAALLVADARASRLYVYSIPQAELLVDLEDIHFADHPGFIPLDDGRVLFTDSLTNQLVALRVLGSSEPHVERRIALGGPPVHLAVSSDQTWAVVSAAPPLTAAPGRFTLVRLDDYSSKIVELPTGEPGVLLGESGGFLYHRNDEPAQIESYRIEDLWRGTIQSSNTMAIGPFPHGEAIVHDAGKIFVAADDGFNVVPVSGGELGPVRVVPYDTADGTGGRAYYARLSADGRYLYSYLRNSGPNFDWPWRDWTNDAFIVDVASEKATRLAVGNGLVYRLADSRKFALFAQYHPDGDFAFLLDTDSGSTTFQTFVAKIPLDAMTQMPTGPDADPWTSVASRITGMVPSGRFGFVTHGGDGKISVIDTAARAVTSTIETPTSLDNGGYLLGVESGSRLSDTIGR